MFTKLNCPIWFSLNLSKVSVSEVNFQLPFLTRIHERGGQQRIVFYYAKVYIKDEFLKFENRNFIKIFKIILQSIRESTKNQTTKHPTQVS